jgi:hypothetical protein
LICLSPFSTDTDPVVGLTVVGTIVAAIAMTRLFLARKRRQALQSAAVQIGFAFEGDDWTDSKSAPFLDGPFLTAGRDPTFKNIMTGAKDGLRVSLFDYSFTTGFGRGSRTTTQTVAAFSRSGASIPSFELRQSGFFDKVGDAFTHKNIQLDSDPEFSKAYVLQGVVPDEVRALFTPSLTSRLVHLDPNTEWHLDGLGDTLLVYRIGRKADPSDLRSFLDHTSAFATSFFGIASLKASQL